MINKKKINVSEPMKASFGFMIASFLQQGILVITTPVFTRVLTEYDYGVTSVFSSWSSILGVIVTLSLVAGVYNNGLLDFKDDSDGFTSSVLGLSTISTIVFFILYMLFKVPVQNIMNLKSTLIIVMFLGFLLNPAMGLWMLKQKFNYKYKLCVILSSFTSIMSPIVSYIAIVNSSNDKASVKIIAGAVVSIIVNAVIYIHLVIKGKKMINLKYWKYALSFNIPLIPHYLANLALAQADRIMISNINGNNKAGIYSIAYSAASVIGLVWSSINASWIPWTLKKMKDKKYADIGAMAKPILLACSGACLGLVAFAPEVIKIFAPPSYYEAIYVVPPVVVGLYFTFVYSLFANVEFYHKKTIPIMIASVIAAALNIGLNFILLPVFGYIAAAYTTLLGYMCLSIMHYIFMKKVEVNKIYDMRYIMILTIFLMLVSAVIMNFYNMVVIRYSIILILLITIIINRKKFLLVIKSIKNN